MNGDDLRHGDTGLPIFPDETPLWDRVRCVLGYHKPEVRIAPRRINSTSGDEMAPMRLRDACGRCGTYLNTTIPQAEAKHLVEMDQPDHEWVGGPAKPAERRGWI